MRAGARLSPSCRPSTIGVQDKYAARDYVREKIGEHVLPRLYWVTKTPADIPFDTLPNQFVVKANHGSEWVCPCPRQNTPENARACGQVHLLVLDTATPYRHKELLPRPPHLVEMTAYAEKLAGGFDFLRVDLYDAGKIYFGEMTIYPYAGAAEFIPHEEWNHYLGGLWDLAFGSTSTESERRH